MKITKVIDTGELSEICLEAAQLLIRGSHVPDDKSKEAIAECILDLAKERDDYRTAFHLAMDRLAAYNRAEIRASYPAHDDAVAEDQNRRKI